MNHPSDLKSIEQMEIISKITQRGWFKKSCNGNLYKIKEFFAVKWVIFHQM
jgi:hypothetical protein